MPQQTIHQRQIVPGQGRADPEGRTVAQQETTPTREPVSTRLSPLRDYLTVVNAVDQIAADPNASAEDKRVCKQFMREFRNCCGQYAVASVCQAYGCPEPIRGVIRETNPCGIGTGGKEIVDFLRSKGIVAAACERGTVEGLQQHVEAGGLAIVLVNADRNPTKFAPHWIVVGKCATTEQPGSPQGEYTFALSDAANLAESPTGVGTITASDLAQAWQKPFGRLSGPILPQDHYWIAVDRIPEGQQRTIPTRVSDASLELLDTLVETPGNTLRESKELLQRVKERIRASR